MTIANLKEYGHDVRTGLKWLVLVGQELEMVRRLYSVYYYNCHLTLSLINNFLAA
jgi:hypothetical protein